MITSYQPKLNMEVDNSSDSDGDLVIDETIILSSDDDEESCPINKYRLPEKEIQAKKILKATTNEDNHWSSNSLYQNLFHPESISSSDMKDELYIEETYTCTLCNESFKYNVGLICHMDTEHKKDLTQQRVNQKKGKSPRRLKAKKIVPVKTGETASHSYCKDPVKRLCGSGSSLSNENFGMNGAAKGMPFKKSCEICKKSFSDQNKLSKHLESCMKVGLNFHCIYCKSKFGWESKYKKHLFRTHKLNAVVICKLCSSVFSDTDSLAAHSNQCDKKHSAKTICADQILPDNDVSCVAD